MRSRKPSYKELQDRLKELEKAARVHEIVEAHLLESEKQLARILNSTSIPTFVIDINHQVTHWNPACENLTAINAMDVLGTSNQWMAFYANRRPTLADLILNQASQSHISKYYKAKFRPSKVVAGAYEVEDFFPHLGANGRWLFFTAAPLKDRDGAVIGAIETLQDVTHAKRMQSSKEAMLRISLALPEYPDLKDLLDFISREVKSLIYVEGALVLLLDEKNNELLFQGTAYDDISIQNRVKALRFSLGELAAGEVIKTGEPLVIQDAGQPAYAFPGRDRKLGYKTRSLLMVPLKSHDRIIGVLCAINKKKGRFDTTDVDLLNMVAGATTLSIENARFSEEIKRAYREVRSLNKAKDKAIRTEGHVPHVDEFALPGLSVGRGGEIAGLEFGHVGGAEIRHLDAGAGVFSVLAECRLGDIGEGVFPRDVVHRYSVGHLLLDGYGDMLPVLAEQRVPRIVELVFPGNAVDHHRPFAHVRRQGCEFSAGCKARVPNLLKGSLPRFAIDANRELAFGNVHHRGDLLTIRAGEGFLDPGKVFPPCGIRDGFFAGFPVPLLQAVHYTSLCLPCARIPLCARSLPASLY